MSNCCGANGPKSRVAQCPRSGSAGVAVDLQTVKALLTEQALARLDPAEYRFCADAGCEVVYYNTAGATFEIDDLRVPVWQKRAFGSRMVCYCFGVSETTIRAEVEATGRSLAVERVREHIAARRCACELRNPRGACCLGDLIAAVKRVQAALASIDVIEGVADAS
ncbi:MAG TPA: hypothetical protein VNI78_09590 [Vicinamibacterales bacterium]|nr:hypothetical protein [Vicinamibacterales bacterium]